MTEEEEEVSKLVQSRSTESKLNLARLNLRCFPSVYPLTLKQIHLRGNKLIELPGALFVDLPHLVWLDIRDNELRELPQQIEHAANLADLLLGGNLLISLPPCLAKLEKLHGLQIQPNPNLISPPKTVIEKGLRAIKEYLLTIPEHSQHKIERDNFDDEVESYFVPKMTVSTQNRILNVSLKNPLTGNQYKEAMEKHLDQHRVPIHLKKWEMMTDEDKLDRTIKNAAIQHELQLMSDEKERQNFRQRKFYTAEKAGDSTEIDLVLNHTKNISMGDGTP